MIKQIQLVISMLLISVVLQIINDLTFLESDLNFTSALENK
jgi:hypothetical protein